MKTTRTLNDNSILTVEAKGDNYIAKVSTDTRNMGFEGDSGPIKKGETIETIADELETYMNDNLNS